MTRLIPAVLLSAVICVATPLGAQTKSYVPTPELIAADGGQVTDATEIVVLTQDQATMATLIAAAGPLGYDALADAGADPLGLVVRVLRIPDGQTGPGAIRQLEALTPGVVAGVNHRFEARSVALPEITNPQRYADQLLRWPEAGCAPRRKIGVIDAVPPAPERRAARRSFVRTAPVDDDHGWLVADLMADPQRLTLVDLYMADVVGQTATGGEAASVDAIVGALGWLEAEGVRLVNISLAGPYNKILDHAFARASERGMVIIAAVGNDGPESPPRFPAAFPGVIAVTAVDAAAAPYSRAVRGAHVDIAAPGVDIFVDGRYVSGSSFAAPFVSAYLAMLDASIDNVDKARAQLDGQARDLGAPGRDALFGAGLLDLGGGC